MTTAFDADALLSEIIYRTHAVSDRRRAEWHIACPVCGHESSPRSPHASFGRKGFHCFVCGAGGGLVWLAGLLGIQGDRPVLPVRPLPAPESPRTPVRWKHDLGAMIARYEAAPGLLAAWAAYKPLAPGTIRAHRLGLGVLPASKCRHPRLIVPIYREGQPVGLRGRAIDCDCAKWLAPAGTVIADYPLYNQEALGQGAVVWITENPIDALMLTERTPYVGVATYSVSYWQDAWLAALHAARPEAVVIAYDNDIPGNGGAAGRAEMERAWLQTHPRVPDPAGPKLANRLLAAGLPTALYDWGNAAPKSDIGSLLMEVMP